MKKAILLWLAMGVSAFAQVTTTTYTGTIKDLAGAVVTSGQVTFTLAPGVDSTISGNARFTPSTVTCPINGSGVLSPACVVTKNSALSPSGTSYRICIQPYFATPGACFYDYAITDTKDISTVAPTLDTGPVNYGGIPGPPGPPGNIAQQGVVYAGSTDTIASMESNCSGFAACTVIVTFPTFIVLPADHTTPASINFQFIGTGAWAISGAHTLTIGSGNVIANQNVQVFSLGTGSSITGFLNSRPEWFGAQVSGSYPYVAVQAAINATATNGTLRLQNANYLSSPTTPLTNARFIHVVGAGKPEMDSQTNPQRFVSGSGSVIQGPFVPSSALTISGIGIDCGSFVVTSKFSGTVCPAGLFLASDHAFINEYLGVDWEHFSVLIKGSIGDSVHAFLLENAYKFVIRDAEIFDTDGSGGAASSYGLIIKSSDGVVDGVKVSGSSAADILCKSDYVTFQDGNCQNNKFTNLTLGRTNATGFAGVWEAAQFDSIFGNTWSNIVMLNESAGWRFDASSSFKVANETITGIVARGMGGACFAAGATAGQMLISNFSCGLAGSVVTGSTGFVGTGQVFNNLETFSAGTGGSAITGIAGYGTVNGINCHDFNGICAVAFGGSWFASGISTTNISGGASSGFVFNHLNNPIQIEADVYAPSGAPIIYRCGGFNTTPFIDSVNTLGGHYWSMDCLGRQSWGGGTVINSSGNVCQSDGTNCPGTTPATIFTAGLFGLGDSYLQGVGATNAAITGGFSLISSDTPAPAYSFGVSGTTAPQIAASALANFAPNPLLPSVTMADGGFNDAANDTCGYTAGTNCIKNYKNAMMAFEGWATIPYQYRQMASVASSFGTWATNTAVPLHSNALLASPGTAMAATSLGATRTFTITSTSATTHVGLTYVVTNSATGTFTVTVDGSLKTDACSGTTTFSTGPCGGTALYGPGLTTQGMPARQEWTVASATSHTVVVTTLSSTSVPIIAADVVPPAGTVNTNAVFIMGTLANYDPAGLYNAASAALAAQLLADGLPVYFVDIRSGTPGVNVTTDLSVTATASCPGSLSAQHPNDCGYQHMRETIYNTEKAVGFIFSNPGQGGKAIANTGIMNVPLNLVDSSSSGVRSLAYSDFSADKNNPPLFGGIDYLRFPGINLGNGYIFADASAGNPWSGQTLSMLYGNGGSFGCMAEDGNGSSSAATSLVVSRWCEEFHTGRTWQFGPAQAPSFRTGSSSNTDSAGTVTLSGGSGTYSFTVTNVTAPICTASDTTSAAAVKVVTTTTTLTLTGTGTDVINYLCMGRT